MGWLTSTIGAALVVVVIVDLLTTAVSVSHGAGPLTARLARTLWRAVLRIHRRFSTPALLVAFGPVMLVVIIAMWVVLLILGWSLVFGHPETLLTVQDGQTVPVLGRLRYAASIVIGRGSGGIRPSGDLYVTLEPVAALTGLTALSLSIAYVLPVVQGVVEKRSLALYISSLGGTPAEIITRAWFRGDTAQLDLHLIALAPRVASVAQSHLAYPVIHYFHSSEPATALGPSMAALDAALTASQRLDPSVAIDPNAVEPLRIAVDRFLQALRLAFIHPADVPEDSGKDRLTETLATLEQHGIPLDPDARREPDEDDIDRTRLLRGYLVHDGWEHLDVLSSRSAA